ncbi:MAG TPA: hypothetical protein VFT39_07065 [Vicinamibacterales bacterium]|nr:hypothetical protein [Vicinamibacterales bacterium]
MRPVSGFERPGLQWLFLALGIVLILVAAGAGVRLQQARTEIATLRAADLNARTAIDQLSAEAARERAARESFSLQLARQRGATAPGTQPTLTLSPLLKRGAQPPDPTVAKPPDHQSIQLRLLLPGRSESQDAHYTIVIRTWSGGDTVWSRSGMTMTTVDNRRMVTAFITGDVFTPGAYEVALTRIVAGGSPADVASYEVAVRP